MKAKRKALVVGAGLGGLTTAMRLVTQGFEICIIEKNEKAGGRLNQLKKDGFIFDIGPSFFSMSYEFKQFAEECSINLPFEFVELDPLYTVHFGIEGKKYTLYKDLDRLAIQFAEIEPNFKLNMARYLDKCGKLFHDTVDIVIKQNFSSLPDYVRALLTVNPIHLPILLKNFYQQIDSYFESNEVKQLLSLVAFFLGRTPFDTSAIYTLLSYTEFQHDGYYNVKGGMYKIVEGLVKQLENKGVEFVYNTEIIDYKNNKSKLLGLIDKEEKLWNADIIVINADAAVFRGSVFNRTKFSLDKLDKKEWTMGYFTMYIGINRTLESVEHHNYFLGENFDTYAHNVYKDPSMLEKPYYYVNVVSKHNKDCAPEGCESLFFVCPVPDLRYKADWSDKQAIGTSMIDDFSQRIGIDISQHIISKTIYTPEDWQNHFNLHRGSGLGLSHNLWQIGHFRPHNIDEKFKNVFYVGASTHPGAGLPMAVISSKLVYQQIVKFCRQNNTMPERPTNVPKKHKVES